MFIYLCVESSLCVKVVVVIDSDYIGKATQKYEKRLWMIMVKHRIVDFETRLERNAGRIGCNLH